jgi:hypothetical protein
MARYNRQTNLTGNKGFPLRGKDFSTLGRPSNQNTFGSQKFQQSALGVDPLVNGAQSALSQGTFQPNRASDTMVIAAVGGLYDNPNSDNNITYNLLAECGDHEGAALITECPTDNQQYPSVVSNIQWITECDQ